MRQKSAASQRAALAALCLCLWALGTAAQVDLASRAGSFYTKVTATYNLGGAPGAGWHNVSQAAFASTLVPGFLADNPAASAIWVKANSSSLQFRLRMALTGTVPRNVRADTLSWQLPRPLGLLFPGAAVEVAASVVNASLSNTTQAISLGISLTFKELPPPGAATNATAADVMDLLKVAIRNATVSENAALLINNITAVQAGATARLTNATFSYVVPSRSQERAITLSPLVAGITRADYLINGTIPLASGPPSSSGASNTSSLSPTSPSPFPSMPGMPGTPDSPAAPSLAVPLKLVNLAIEDVSSFFIGSVESYNLSASMCRLTNDPCCSSCDPKQSCVMKPLCLPTEALTLEDQLCFADSSIPCWQRSYGCGTISDVSPTADILYHVARGLWGNDSPYGYWGGGWDYNKCAPYRVMGCLYNTEPSDCGRWGSCRLAPRAICLRDNCTVWDATKNVSVTDPCCGFKGDCSQAPLPLTEAATCQWDDSKQSCWLRRVDNCTASGGDMEAKLLCRMADVAKANAAKPLPELGANICNATGVCAVPGAACSMCMSLQSKLVAAMRRVSDEASYCRVIQRDASPHYNTTGIEQKHGRLVKGALQLLLQANVMCTDVAAALLSTPANASGPLLSAANIADHGGAWVCASSPVAPQLCGGGGGGELDCSHCGVFMEQFAARVAAGNASFTAAHVVAFCSEKVLEESQQGGGGGDQPQQQPQQQPQDGKYQQQPQQQQGSQGMEDWFAEPDVCRQNWQQNRWCPTYMGCEYKARCMPQNGSAPEVAACAAVTNATACSARDECVFVRPSEVPTLCLRAVMTIGRDGIRHVLNHPESACAHQSIDWAVNGVKSLCGGACMPYGYCNTTGANDTQCEAACSGCRRCTADITAIAQAVEAGFNLTGSSMWYDWHVNQQHAVAALKLCIAQHETVASSSSSSPGRCLAKGSAVCAIGEAVGSCSELSACYRQDMCAKFDTAMCNPAAPRGVGRACQVARVCEALLVQAPSVLPAATVCGAGYLNVCATATSAICTKCLAEAVDLQNRLRSLSNYQCRRPQYYVPLQSQECTTVVNGWLSAQSVCAPVLAPGMYDLFRAAQANTSSQSGYFYWDYNSQNAYSGFCNAVADAIIGRNASTPLDAKAGWLPGRHLLQAAGDFNASLPMPLSGDAPWNASDPAMWAFNSSNGGMNMSYPLPGGYEPSMPPCSHCNELPAWVYEAVANASALPPPAATPSCSGGDNATCAAPPPPPEPAFPAILLVQTRHDDPAANAAHFFTHLPQAAVDAAARAVFETYGSPRTWQQPHGLPDAFGCAGWPPVEAAMAAAAGAPPSAPAPAPVPAPALEAAAAPQLHNISCTVDALVASNLLAGALLEQHLPCTNDEHGAAMRMPYTGCTNFTVTWLPPASRCGSNASACVSHTFRFQLERYVPCETLAPPPGGTSSNATMPAPGLPEPYFPAGISTSPIVMPPPETNTSMRTLLQTLAAAGDNTTLPSAGGNDTSSGNDTSLLLPPIFTSAPASPPPVAYCEYGNPFWHNDISNDTPVVVYDLFYRRLNWMFDILPPECNVPQDSWPAECAAAAAVTKPLPLEELPEGMRVIAVLPPDAFVAPPPGAPGALELHSIPGSNATLTPGVPFCRQHTPSCSSQWNWGSPAGPYNQSYYYGNGSWGGDSYGNGSWGGGSYGNGSWGGGMPGGGGSWGGGMPGMSYNFYDNGADGYFQSGPDGNVTYMTKPPMPSYSYDPIASYYYSFNNNPGTWQYNWTCLWQAYGISRMMQGGYVPASAEGLLGACMDVSIQQGNPEFMRRQYSGELQCSTWSDACCTSVGLQPGSKEVCEASSPCAYTASCTVAIDTCYTVFKDSLTTTSLGDTFAVCPSSCAFQPMPAAGAGDALFRPLPTMVTTAAGNTSISNGICYNRTLWDTCTSKTTEGTCKLWAYGNNTCSWVSRCAKPASADFNCEGSADSCCMSSPAATFTSAMSSACSTRTGSGGKPCKVAQACSLLVDPCSNHSTPWGCMADAACQFVPTRDPRMGGACVVLPQSDPCRSLSAAKCSSTPACRPIDRCVTDRCTDSSDACCAHSGDDGACSSVPGCRVATTCMPAVDECASLANETMCGTLSYCRWQAFQMDAFRDISMLNGSSATNPATSTATNSTTAPICKDATCTTPIRALLSEAAVSSSSKGSSPDSGGMSMPPQPGVCMMDGSRHPCAQASDAASCMSIKDVVGRPRCMAQSYCQSSCSKCGECLDVVRSSWGGVLSQLSEADGINPVTVSQAFSAWCSGLNEDATLCKTIAGNIAYSPKASLARRPGMLCSLAGMCPAGCTVPAPRTNASSAATNATKLALDLCSDDGTAAGQPVPAPVNSTGSCKSDADCTGGAWCAFNFTADKVCTCDKGWDACQVVGTCDSDTCPLYTFLTSLNTDKSPCSNNTACGAGKVCQAEPYKTFSCAVGVITSTTHAGFCVEAAPGITTAQLDDSATSITVALGIEAAPMFARCSAIFSPATSAKIGADALCSVSSAAMTTLSIRLQNVPTLVWGTDVLALAPNQTSLISFRGKRAFAGNTTSAVASCVDCPAPTAVLLGPTFVTKPCIGEADSFRPVFLDASASFGSAAAPITSFTWELARGSSDAIAAAVDAINAQTNLMDKMTLVLDGAALSASPADTYTILVTVSNQFGASSFEQADFTLADAGSKPSIRVFAPGGSDRAGGAEVDPSRGLRLFSVLQVDSICKAAPSRVQYLWSCTAGDGSACRLPSAAAGIKQLRLEPTDLVGFSPGINYTFTLTAGFAGSTAVSTASTLVRLMRSPLSVSLLGPMGDVPYGRNITLDAGRSADPDNPAASLDYRFTCSPQPCFANDTYRGVFPRRSSWVIDTSQMAVGVEYTLSVTVTGTAAADDSRTASASLAITPRAGNPPTGTVSRFCGYDVSDYSALPCPAKHNPTQDLVVVLQPDAGFEEAGVTWSLPAGSGATLQEGVNAVGLRRTTLHVRPAAFATGSFRLLATMSMPGVSGAASISIPLNMPPSCPKAPCFFTDVNTTVFPAFTFVGTVNGWLDADGDALAYEFGQVTNGDYVARDPAGPSTSYIFKGFQPGSYTLYACAIDTSGARSCATVSVRVAEPVAVSASAAIALVEDSVAKIDVSQLASTGDVGAVTAAMQEFASLASFAASTASSGGSGGDGGGAGAPTPPPAVSPEVVAKQNALLTTLTSVMNTKDPASMGSSLTAAGAVSSNAAGSLSAAAGGALLDVVEGFVNANKGAKTAGIPDSQVKTATEVLAKGLKAAFTAAAAAPTRRRGLLQDSTGASGAAAQAYQRLAASTSGLLSLISAGTATGTTKVTGSADICLAVSRDSGASGALDGKALTLDCGGAAAAGGRRRELLAAVAGSPSVVMPANFSGACAADPACSGAVGGTTVSVTYVADPDATMAAVKNWPATSLLGGEVATEANTSLSVISGVVTVQLGSTTAGAICSGNASAECVATVTLPVAGYDAGRSTTCLRLDALVGDPAATLQAATSGVAVLPANVTASSVVCTTSALGKLVAVQFTPQAPPAASPSPSPAASSPAPSSSPSPAASPPAASPVPSPSPSPALGANETEYVLSDAAVPASDVGTPASYSFTFSNLNYSALFLVNGSVSEAANTAFQRAVKAAFLAGVASKVGLRVGPANSPATMQLGRVNITGVRPGSVLVDLTFWPPALTADTDMATLAAAVAADPAAFFAAPAFVASYGTPAVTGAVLPAGGGGGFFGVSPTVALAVGIGVGVGGALLIGIAVAVFIAQRRRTQTLAPGAAEYDAARQGPQAA